MIVALLFLIAGTIMNAFVGLLTTLNFVLPAAISNGVQYLVGIASILQPLFPVDQFILAMKFMLVVLLFKYGFKFFFALLNIIPGVSVHYPFKK